MKYELLIDTPDKKRGEIVNGHGENKDRVCLAWQSGDAGILRSVDLVASEWPAIFKPVKELKEIRFVRVEDRRGGCCTGVGQYIIRHFSTHSDSMPFCASGGTLNIPFTIYRREDIYE